MAKSIDEILQDRRQKNQFALEDRKKEIYQKEPLLKELDNKIKQLHMTRLTKRLNNEPYDEFTKALEQTNLEKDKLLTSIGHTRKDLEMQYDCDICKDTGVDNLKSCVCVKQIRIDQLYEQSRIQARIEEENFSTFNLNLYRKSRQFDERISPYEHMKNSLKQMKAYVNHFSSKSPNLYLYGNVGTGKTFMLNCLAKALMDQGVEVIYQSSTELFSFFNSYLFMYSEDKREHARKANLIYDIEVLIIDDLGSEFINDATKTNLFDIINQRIVSGKVTIISSNIEIYNLERHYDKRIFSRIMGEFNPLEFYGNDLRLGV